MAINIRSLQLNGTLPLTDFKLNFLDKFRCKPQYNISRNSVHWEPDIHEGKQGGEIDGPARGITKIASFLNFGNDPKVGS
jgi:hypothetical protein